MDSINNSSKIFLLDQVEDLGNRAKFATESGDYALTHSLVMEYVKLINSATGHTGSDKRLLRELLLLKAETVTCPPKNKDDRLVQLRWLNNSISKLKLIVKQLCPIDTKLNLELHPRVLATSEKLFQDGYYSQAVFEAFKALEEYVREKSGAREWGKGLMAKVFKEDRPILQIKYSRPDTAKEEQEGFRFIFMGSMVGIRNPKAHYTITQLDGQRTLQHLALASLLFKTVDDATLAQNTQ